MLSIRSVQVKKPKDHPMPIALKWFIQTKIFKAKIRNKELLCKD